MKRFWKIGLCVFAIMTLCALLTACFGGPSEPAQPPKHVHTYNAEHTCTDCGDVLTQATGLSFALCEDGESYALTGIGSETKKGFIVPESYKGKPISRVEAGAFDANTTLEAVVLPNRITEIGDRAFAQCTALRYLVLPEALALVGRDAIYPNGNLQTTAYENALYLGSETQPYLYLLKGKNASITKCTVHADTKFVGSGAFDGCTKLANVVLPDSIVSVAQGALGTAKNVTMPAHVISAVSGAGRYADTVRFGSAHLENITVRGGKVDAFAFYGCANLKSVTLQNVTSIGNDAFGGCRRLSEVTFGTALTTIGARAFAQCERLLKAELPASLREVGANAFADCDYLTEITLPNGLQSVGSYAFDGASELAFTLSGNGYYLGNAQNPHLLLVKAKSTDITSCTIHQNTKLVTPSAFAFCRDLALTEHDGALYVGSAQNPHFVLAKAADPSITACTTHPETRVIADSAFEHCTDLTSLAIGAKVHTIGARTTYRTSALASVTVDSANAHFFDGGNCVVKQEGKVLILGCKSTSVYLVADVRAIGEYAFYGCEGLSAFAVPDGVLTIGNHAFEDCVGLQAVALPESLYCIGEKAFYRSGLKTIALPASLCEIGSGAFGYCNSLQQIDASQNEQYTVSLQCLVDLRANAVIVGYGTCGIPTSVSAIADYAFAGNRNLQSVTVPTGVTAIGEYAFAQCDQLRTITFADSVAVIGSNAFYGCDKLESVTLPSALYAIEDYLFGGCEQLREVRIPTSVSVIRGYAFFGCAALEKICYDGTEAQWNQIIFGDAWDLGAASYQLICQ